MGEREIGGAAPYSRVSRYQDPRSGAFFNALKQCETDCVSLLWTDQDKGVFTD